MSSTSFSARLLILVRNLLIRSQRQVRIEGTLAARGQDPVGVLRQTEPPPGANPEVAPRASQDSLALARDALQTGRELIQNRRREWLPRGALVTTFTTRINLSPSEQICL